MVLVGGAFGKCLCHEGRATWGTLGFIKYIPQSSLSPSCMWGCNKMSAA